MTPHIVLYIPGLGDRNLTSRQKLLNLWRFKKVSIEIHSMQWSVNEPWDDKLARLLVRINKYKQLGKTVSLIGESAGASAAINALVRTDALDSVLLLCGKIQYPNRVAAWRYEQNPSLKEALANSHRAVRELTAAQKQQILNLYPIYDPVVPVAETKIAGVKNSRMPIIGHATSIVFANTLWSWHIVAFIRSKAKK